MEPLTVGRAATETGWSARMLRYLEEHGLAFALRLRREPELRRAVDGWLAAGDDTGSWIDWEQRKQERLLAA